MDKPQERKKQRWWWNWRVKILVGLLPFHLLYSFYCQHFLPPTTLTQIGAVLSDRVTFRRYYVSREKISRNLYLAVIAEEDTNFLQHGGFEWDSMRQALLKGRGSGSTISQQTAKNTFAWQHQDYVRKALEMYSTVLIEKTWGKQRIMEVYVNVIEFEEGVYGAEAVAQEFFHKPASQLTRREAATIAACVPQPKGCLRHRTNSPVMRKVQAHVLKEMTYIGNQKGVRDFLEQMSK